MIKSVCGALAALALLGAASGAAAEVVARTADSFTLRYEAPGFDLDPHAIPGSLARVGRWWDGAHTYSGDAANLSLVVTPGGCWCERLADGTQFEHARVVSIAPDQIVFDAPFGPLKGKATRAVLTVSWPEPHGVSTPTWAMEVEGPGLGAMADAVDAVMGAGFERWLRFTATGAP